MPRALLFEQVFEAVGGLLGVVLHEALYSSECAIWIALAIGARVTPMILVVVAHVVLALAANGVALSIRLDLFVGP
jgi:hypothetical protein